MNRTSEILVSAAIAVGALVVSSVIFIAESIVTGVPDLDRPAIRFRVAFQAFRHFGMTAVWDLSIPRALMAIVNNESRGNAKFYLGDVGSSGGPSIGPMQVYRRTAKDLKLWTPPEGATVEEEREAYKALSQNEALGIKWGVAVFADKYRIAKGDLTEAVRRYNGSGPSAEDYRDRAVAFFAQKWGAIT